MKELNQVLGLNSVLLHGHLSLCTFCEYGPRVGPYNLNLSTIRTRTTLPGYKRFMQIYIMEIKESISIGFRFHSVFFDQTQTNM